MRRFILLAVVIGVLGSVSLVQAAETRNVRFYGLGPRIGFSLEPDQFVFGGHADFGDLFPNANLVLPVIEIGVGNDVTVTSIGADLLYRFSDRFGDWTPFAGGELAFIISSYDLPNGEGDTNTDLGLSGVVGVDKRIGESNRFGVEAKIGFMDSPDFKVMATWTFGS